MVDFYRELKGKCLFEILLLDVFILNICICLFCLYLKMVYWVDRKKKIIFNRKFILVYDKIMN